MKLGVNTLHARRGRCAFVFASREWVRVLSSLYYFQFSETTLFALSKRWWAHSKERRVTKRVEGGRTRQVEREREREFHGYKKVFHFGWEQLSPSNEWSRGLWLFRLLNFADLIKKWFKSANCCLYKIILLLKNSDNTVGENVWNFNISVTNV